MANLNRLAEIAVNGSEKSKLGGVKKESAVKVIKEVAEEGSRQIEQLTQTASSQSARITGLSQEVQTATQQLKNANASLAYAHGELAIKDKALTETTELLNKTKVSTKSEPKLVKCIKDGGDIIEEFSDGSKVLISHEKLDVSDYKSALIIEKISKDGNVTETYREVNKVGGDKLTFHVLKGDDTVVTKVYTTSDGLEYVKEKTLSTNEFGKKFISQSKYKSKAGEIVYRPTQTDKKGNVIKAESVATYKYPTYAADTQAKTVKTSFIIDNSDTYWRPQHIRTSDTVIMQDGSRLERLYNKENQIYQELAYDSNGKRMNHLKDSVQFSKHSNDEPLSVSKLSLALSTLI